MNSNIPCRLFIGLTLLAVLATACASATQAPSTPTPLIFVTETLPSISIETPAAIPTFTQTLPPVTGDATALPAFTPTIPATVPPVSTNICADPQASALIDSLKKAVSTADGPLLASLVSPTSGMDVAFYHNGNVINYDQEHAKFLFETTFEANWGMHPASGEETIGSFHDIVVPELVKSFNQPYTLHCNELKYGGASYPVTFPYDKDFYSIYFPGTEANGNLDWHTWVAGIEYVNGKPYLYALIQFFWEP